MLYPSQLQAVTAQIKEIQVEIKALEDKKGGLFGLTVESYCQKKLNELYIFNSFYKDKKTEIPLYSEEDFDFLDQEELQSLVSLYHAATIDINSQNIKKIALLPFFQNYYGLCEDNLSDFFGMPVARLSFFQNELGSYGRYFKSILSSSERPPADVAADPEKLIDWYNATKGTGSVINKNNNDNVVLVGASAELSDGNVEAVSFSQIAKEQGKTKLNKFELMNLLNG